MKQNHEQYIKSLTERIAPVLLDGPATRSTLGLNYPQTQALQEAKVIAKRKTVVKSGRQGRPAHLFGLTDAARKRAKREAAKVNAATA